MISTTGLKILFATHQKCQSSIQQDKNHIHSQMFLLRNTFQQSYAFVSAIQLGICFVSRSTVNYAHWNKYLPFRSMFLPYIQYSWRHLPHGERSLNPNENCCELPSSYESEWYWMVEPMTWIEHHVLQQINCRGVDINRTVCSDWFYSSRLCMGKFWN